MNSLFCCFLFSPGMPVLYPIGVVTFVVMYWVDKVSEGGGKAESDGVVVVF